MSDDQRWNAPIKSDEPDASFPVDVTVEEVEPAPLDEAPAEQEHEEHERPPEPPVPDGEDVSDPFEIKPRPDLDTSAAEALRIERNTEVSPRGASISQVCEPTIASRSNISFYTANWFAALSTDGGTTFSYVNPYRLFGPPPRFCCDQVVVYIPQIDMFVWSMQSVNYGLHRLLFGRPAEIAQGQWRRITLTPQSLGVAGAAVDYPDMAASTTTLYWSTNVFRHNRFNSVAVRIPLDGLATGNPQPRAWRSSHSSLRFARNCERIGYFAAHHSRSRLRVYSWSDTTAEPTWSDVQVPTWNGNLSVSPWIRGSGSRVMGGARRGNELWFGWNVGPRSGRPHPFAQIARIDITTLRHSGSADIWARNAAAGFPSLAVNSVTNEVGVSYGIGLNAASHAVGLLTGTPVHATTIQGYTDSNKRWGDYLSIRQHFAGGETPEPSPLFVASGFALDRNVRARPHAIWFERGGYVRNGTVRGTANPKSVFATVPGGNPARRQIASGAGDSPAVRTTAQVASIPCQSSLRGPFILYSGKQDLFSA